MSFESDVENQKPDFITIQGDQQILFNFVFPWWPTAGRQLGNLTTRQSRWKLWTWTFCKPPHDHIWSHFPVLKVHFAFSPYTFGCGSTTFQTPYLIMHKFYIIIGSCEYDYFRCCRYLSHPVMKLFSFGYHWYSPTILFGDVCVCWLLVGRVACHSEWKEKPKRVRRKWKRYLSAH